MLRMMAGLAAALGLAAPGAGALAKCQINAMQAFDLQPSSSRALVKAAINGHPVTFIADTGAAISTIPFGQAARLGIRRTDTTRMESEGIGGATMSGEGTFELKLGSFTYPNESMMLVDMSQLDHDAVGLLGRDLLAQHDIDIDWAGHSIKILKTEGCEASQLDYWDKPYAQVALQGDGTSRPAILFMVGLNGHLVPAMLDSGSPRTIVSSRTAVAAGARLEGAVAQGDMRGIGAHALDASMARFDTISIGDETVRNVRLKVSDMWKYNRSEQIGSLLGGMSERADSPRVLIGADFLRSHHVLVSNADHVMVFSYLGGPVFEPPEAPLGLGPQSSPSAGGGSAP